MAIYNLQGNSPDDFRGEPLEVGRKVFLLQGRGGLTSGWFVCASTVGRDGKQELVEMGGFGRLDHWDTRRDGLPYSKMRADRPGRYWDDRQQDLCSDDEVRGWVDFCEDKVRERLDDQMRALRYVRQRYTDLEPVQGRERPMGAAMYNVCQLLSKTFPDTPFHVLLRERRTLEIEWTDGPTDKEVAAVVERFHDLTADNPGAEKLLPALDTAFIKVYGGFPELRLVRHQTLESQSREAFLRVAHGHRYDYPATTPRGTELAHEEGDGARRLCVWDADGVYMTGGTLAGTAQLEALGGTPDKTEGESVWRFPRTAIPLLVQLYGLTWAYARP
jgi:hypothetical protein